MLSQEASSSHDLLGTSVRTLPFPWPFYHLGTFMQHFEGRLVVEQIFQKCRIVVVFISGSLFDLSVSRLPELIPGKSHKLKSDLFTSGVNMKFRLKPVFVGFEIFVDP